MGDELYTIPGPFGSYDHLWVKASEDKFYWGVGECEPESWEEISLELYRALMIHKEDYYK